jgi:hypothetical protein
MLVGDTQTSSDSYWDREIYLVNIDESGHHIFETIHELRWNDAPPEISIFSSGEGAIITYPGWAFKINKKGGLVWEKKVKRDFPGPTSSAGLGLYDGGFIMASKHENGNVESEDLDQYVCSKCFTTHTMVSFDDQGEEVWTANLRDKDLIPVSQRWEDYEDNERASTYPRIMALGINGTFVIVGQRNPGSGWWWAPSSDTYIATFRVNCTDLFPDLWDTINEKLTSPKPSSKQLNEKGQTRP